MRSAFLRFAAALFMMCAMPWSTVAHADPADIAATARSVVRVVLVANQDGQLSLIGHGSGVAIAPDLILTNAHVVAPAEEYGQISIGIVPSQGRKSGWFARILGVSPRNDLALLKLTEPGSLPVATLFTGAVDDGADVYAVGYPGNVDMAQGLNIGDIVSPTPPVKTRGNVSAGRSSKQFDTILHTAPIGSGNSGGPLLDACGRIVGINSFGALSGESDSEFYFAVSMREVSRFLLAAKVQPQTTGVACRSNAELDRAEAERLAGEQFRSDEAARADAARRGAAMEDARRQAQFAVIGERENRMALTGLALLLALASAGAGIVFQQKGREREMKIAAGGCILLLLAGAAAWLSRPSLNEIEDRAGALAAKGQPSAAASHAAPATAAGELACVLDTARSRVTVSETTDVPLNWRADGCVNGQTQYGHDSSGWSRILVPEGDDTVTVASFDPASATYRTDRYFPASDDMDKLRAARARIKAPACGAGGEAAGALGREQDALRAMLPATANERLVYRCQKAAAPAP